jgi:acetyl-CoA carboxylase carboxyltransferase component
MGGAQAAKTLLQIKLASVKEEISEKEKEAMLNEITQKYEEETTPYYAASRLWIDEIIDPTETRKWISMGIEAANHKPVEGEYIVGNIQT